MKKTANFITIAATLFGVILLVVPMLQGCKKTQPVKPVKPEKTQNEITKPATAQVQRPETVVKEEVQEEGYIYQAKDRRDPFVPLIVPTRKAEARGAGAPRLGTLESYDISEFALLAIAKKGEKYFALLMTPDNRSFTVSKGTRIGLMKGQVEEITGNKVDLVEYLKDFRGNILPKQITLELKER